MPLAYAEEEKAAINDLLKKGVIIKALPLGLAQSFFIRKKLGAVHPCIEKGERPNETRRLPFALGIGLSGRCHRYKVV